MSGRYSLSVAQQYFLQIILNKSVIDQHNFKNIFCSVLKKFDIDYEESQLKYLYVEFLKAINDVIRNFNLEIKNGTCEITGLTYYCIVRLSETCSIGNLSMLYTPVELKVFRIILNLIIESEEGYVDFGSAISRVGSDYDEIMQQAATQSQTTKIPTNKEIRLIIEKFMHDYWLVEVEGYPNTLTLHGRTIIELGSYIKEVFEDDVLKNCSLCKNILLNGIECESCDAKIHRYCAKKAFRDKPEKKCPKCNKQELKDSLGKFII